MRPALRKAPRSEFLKRPATPTQHHRIAELARDLGMEKPNVFWSHQAVEVITRLEAMQRQPVLAGFSASTATSGGSDE